jgi:hypothetical protein
VAKDGGLWAQKRSEPKPPLSGPKSHVYMASYLREAHGHPLSIKSHSVSEEKAVNER